VASRIEGGMPVYAECAGMMYLCRAIRWKGKRYEMAGVIPAEVELSERPAGHGYVEAEVVGANPFFGKGRIVRGHEFHHSRLAFDRELGFAWKIRRGHGIDGTWDGIVYKHVFAAYTHLHALGAPEWAGNFVGLIMNERKAEATAGANRTARRSCPAERRKTNLSHRR
jgi:cobyrinic acid a,c-diamide synthase